MNNDIMKSVKYKHLNFEERENISLQIARGKNQSEIALTLGRNKSTISREIKRNVMHYGNELCYIASKADKKSVERKRKACKKERLKNKKIRELVEDLICVGHSPRTASYILKEQYNLKINYESIYQWIYKEQDWLVDFLSQKHRKRLKRGLKRKKRSLIKNRVDITLRPAEANDRTEFGHFEVDLIVSSKSTASILVIVERKSRYCLLKLLPDKKALTVHNALIKELKKFPPDFCKTITYDNGSENTLHEKTNEALNTQSYFASNRDVVSVKLDRDVKSFTKPYHCWEKGSVENLNKLIRRFIPKTTDLNLITQQQLYIIKNNINMIPRKANNFNSANKSINVALLN